MLFVVTDTFMLNRVAKPSIGSPYIQTEKSYHNVSNNFKLTNILTEGKLKLFSFNLQSVNIKEKLLISGKICAGDFFFCWFGSF